MSAREIEYKAVPVLYHKLCHKMKIKTC